MEYLNLFLTLVSIFSALGIGAAVVLTALKIASKITRTDFLDGKQPKEVTSDAVKEHIRELEDRNRTNEDTILRLSEEVSYYKRLLDTGVKNPGKRKDSR